MGSELLRINLSRREFLKRSGLIAFGLGVGFVIGCDNQADSKSGGTALPTEPRFFEEGFDVQFSSQLAELVNLLRQQNGLSPLSVHPALELAARDYSEILAKNDWFSHDGPDGSTPFDRMNSAGFTYNTFKGENITLGGNWTSPEDIFNLLFESEGHKANMLNPNFEFIGSACYVSKTTNYMRWCVQDFGGKTE